MTLVSILRRIVARARPHLPLPEPDALDQRGEFVQTLTPAQAEEMRQAILRGRALQKRMQAEAFEAMREFPQLASTMCQTLAMTEANSAQFEAVAALRWGVTVPQEETL